MLAAAAALDETGGDLRSALVALSTDSPDGRAAHLSDGENLCGAVYGSPTAHKLVGRVASAWCSQLEQSA